MITFIEGGRKIGKQGNKQGRILNRGMTSFDQETMKIMGYIVNAQ